MRRNVGVMARGTRVRVYDIRSNEGALGGPGAREVVSNGLWQGEVVSNGLWQMRWEVQEQGEVVSNGL